MPAFDPEETLAASLADDRFAAIAAIRAWPSIGASRPRAVARLPKLSVRKLSFIASERAIFCYGGTMETTNVVVTYIRAT